MTGPPASTALAADPAGVAGARFCELGVEVGDGVRLRVLHWLPEASPTLPRIVFVAGWISVVEGWATVLRALAPRAEVLYLETREKASARLPDRRMGPADFAVGRIAADLVEACRGLGIVGSPFVFFASSMGANAVLEALLAEPLGASAAFLVAPNGEFRYPWWGHLLVRMPAGLYRQVLPGVVWYLKRFRVNSAADPAQMRRYERTLDAAEPYRLKLSAIANAGYRPPRELCRIDIPVAVAYANSDTLHGGCRCEELVAALPRGRLLRCPTNSSMHDVTIVRELEGFLGSLGCGEAT